MRGVVALLQSLRRYVRVHLRRRQVFVAEQFLDTANIGTGVEQVRGKTMSQRVR